MAAESSVTDLLADASRGDQAALDVLLPLVYSELRRLADSYLREERPDHTLQGTALVHEAYLRLVGRKNINWQNRAHFFSVAAQVMRHVLVDHARGHKRKKRGGDLRKLSLDDAIGFSTERDISLIALDDALTTLASLDPQQSRIVELRFFGGLTIDEVAEVLKISTATVNREWGTAKAWLYREIHNRGAEPE